MFRLYTTLTVVSLLLASVKLGSSGEWDVEQWTNVKLLKGKIDERVTALPTTEAILLLGDSTAEEANVAAYAISLLSLQSMLPGDSAQYHFSDMDFFYSYNENKSKLVSNDSSQKLTVKAGCVFLIADEGLQYDQDGRVDIGFFEVLEGVRKQIETVPTLNGNLISVVAGGVECTLLLAQPKYLTVEYFSYQIWSLGDNPVQLQFYSDDYTLLEQKDLASLYKYLNSVKFVILEPESDPELQNTAEDPADLKENVTSNEEQDVIAIHA